MTPEQMKARTQGIGGGAPAVGKIEPEMRDLLVKQAAEAAAAQTGADIDAHNARIELREKHADEAKQLAEKLKKQADANATLKEAAAKSKGGK